MMDAFFSDTSMFNIDQPKTRLIFNEDEIREIVDKRDKYDRKLMEDDKPKLKDILEYIVYERVLLSKATKLQEEKKSEFHLTVTIVEKMQKLYELATDQYPQTERLWDQYIIFCNNHIAATGEVRNIVKRMRLMNENLPEFWLKAIQWECKYYKGPDRLESLERLTADGYKKHPRSIPIFVELISAILCSEYTTEIRTKRALDCYKNRLKNLDSYEFHVTLLELAGKHEFAGELEQQILDEMQKLYFMMPVYWHMLALRELDGKRTYDYDPEAPPRTHQQRIQCCYQVYDAGVNVLNSAEICEYYVNTMHKVYKNKEAPEEFRFRMLARALKRVNDLGLMSVRQYGLFVDVMRECGVNNQAIEDVIKRAVKLHSESLAVWMIYMQHCMRVDDLAKVTDVFRQSRRKIPTENAPIWKMYLQFIQASPNQLKEVKKCYEEVILQESPEFDQLKVDYLEFLFMMGGIQSMRKGFRKLCTLGKLSIDMFDKIYEFESLKDQPDVINWRQMISLATKNLGSENELVWLKACEFEKSHGTPEDLKQLYMRAGKILTADMLSKLSEHFKE